jgi:hypothetical protein
MDELGSRILPRSGSAAIRRKDLLIDRFGR